MIEFPVPADVPPQDPVNHSAVAPVPAVPPTNVNVVDAPEQIVLVPDMEVGATLGVFTVTLVVAADDVHPPTVTVQLYVPAIAAVTEGLLGSSKLEEKADGPVHE